MAICNLPGCADVNGDSSLDSDMPVDEFKSISLISKSQKSMGSLPVRFESNTRNKDRFIFAI
ncbi:unnamed protein product [Toxocara canis]|uniref:Lipoprotein n=1 Tax=Toxocara canis TaxID=6265 RepID=A0A183U1T9_TOXCA|nr:unnamed protein product [Toxocara canis]